MLLCKQKREGQSIRKELKQFFDIYIYIFTLCSVIYRLLTLKFPKYTDVNYLYSNQRDYINSFLWSNCLISGNHSETEQQFVIYYLVNVRECETTYHHHQSAAKQHFNNEKSTVLKCLANNIDRLCAVCPCLLLFTAEAG